MDVKEFKTWKEQVAKLIEHGCIDIKSDEFAIDILKKVNYYRLTAYFLPFRDKETQKYDSNKVSLEKIYEIYCFDAELRLLIFKYIEDIELYFRTQVAYYHGKLYGALAYKDKTYFNKFHKHDEFLEGIDKELGHRKKSLIYKHHQIKYDGVFPIWVLVEFFTFGMTSKFFADSPTDVQQSIANNVGLKSSQIRTYLEVSVVLRNYCAHYNRLYYTSFTKIPGQLPSFMHENSKLKNRLMAQLYAIKCLYPDKKKWNDGFLRELSELIQRYREAIHLHHIGFIDNWKEVLKK